MAWNEPGGEKRNPWNRPQQSQNDLDDVLRNFQRRLSALFGRGGGGGLGGGQSSPGMGKGVSSILVLIAAVWVGSGLYRVDAQERAVILRFGKYMQTTGPGLQLASAVADRTEAHRQRLAAVQRHRRCENAHRRHQSG